MRCDKCGADCTNNYHAYSAGSARMIFCGSCAAAAGLDIRGGLGAFGLSDMQSLFKAFAAGPVLLNVRDEKCPACGVTFKKFRDTGYLGCDSCYQVFRAALMPVINDIQLAAKHIGKSPNGAVQSQQTTAVDTAAARYQNLAQALQQAIADERYEDAGVIQRKMKEMRNNQ